MKTCVKCGGEVIGDVEKYWVRYCLRIANFIQS